MKEHPILKREGNNLILEAPISFIQAINGGTIEVPTLNGRAEIKIPAGTESETVFRMRGKGLPKIDGFGRGDQYVKVKVVVPKKLNRKQQKLLNELAETMGEEVSPQKNFFQKFKEMMK